MSSSIKPFDDPETGQLSHKQALMQAGKLEATTPYNLEIQNFLANRLWALAHIPKGFKGQITWSEVDRQPALSALGAWHPAGLDAPAGQHKRGRSRHEGIFERRSQFTDG